jgi:hypothetical protein
MPFSGNKRDNKLIGGRENDRFEGKAATIS